MCWQKQHLQYEYVLPNDLSIDDPRLMRANYLGTHGIESHVSGSSRSVVEPFLLLLYLLYMWGLGVACDCVHYYYTMAKADLP